MVEAAGLGSTHQLPGLVGCRVCPVFPEQGIPVWVSRPYVRGIVVVILVFPGLLSWLLACELAALEIALPTKEVGLPLS